MQIESWPIDKPVPYARNARNIGSNAIDKVAASLKEFGFRQPIVVDEEGVILVGHTRLAAAKQLGLAEVPVHVAKGLNKAQAKAYRLMDNRSHEEASWDNDLLKVEFEELGTLDIELSMTGFGQDEIDALLADDGPGDEGEGGSGESQEARQTLSDRFGIPPFTVLNAREGWWQERKRAWIGLGIKSEVGRGGNLLNFSEQCNAAQRGEKPYGGQTLGAIAPNQKDILKRTGSYASK